MIVSMNDAWDDAQAFVRREFALLLPIGFATFGLALLVWELVAPQQPKPTSAEAARLVIAFPFLLLAMLYGSMAISLLVLRPGLSVAEALRLGGRRMPLAVLVLVVASVALAALFVAAMFVSFLLGGLIGWGGDKIAEFAVAIAIPAMIWAGVRVFPLWPLIADNGDRAGAITMLRECFALTRGGFWRLCAITILFLIATLLLSNAIQFAFGSVLLLLGRAIGNPELGRLLTAVLMAVIGTLTQSVWIVYVACIYRRMTASGGT